MYKWYPGQSYGTHPLRKVPRFVKRLWRGPSQTRFPVVAVCVFTHKQWGQVTLTYGRPRAGLWMLSCSTTTIVFCSPLVLLVTGSSVEDMMSNGL